MQTFLEFKTRLRAELWPSGEAQSLRVSHDSYFNAAMLDIQKWVPCVRQMNVSTWEFSTTKWENAKTVVNAPWGKIKRVYTVAGGEDKWRDRVRYRSSNYADIECWAKGLFRAITPTNSNSALPALQMGMRYADATQDSTVGRARIGAWAIERKRLYIAPYLQSTEMLVVDWDGHKSKWLDSDGVDETYWTTDYEMAIKAYVMWKHELFHTRDRAAANDAKAEYDQTLADLMYWCREFTKQQHDTTCDAGTGGDETVGITAESVEDDDDPEEDTTETDNVLFNAVGDLGDTGANAAAVALKVIADNPEVFFALGDLTYNGDYAGDFGANYQSFLDSGKLVPVVGNHDISENGNTIDAFNAYFDPLVGSGSGHYEYTIGPVHVLIFNSEDTDNIDVDSAQAEWLRAKLFLSTARWKIVLMHRPPYSSDSTHGSDTDLQLPFASWGADVVIAAHGHDYERLEVGGLPYIVVGTGGHPLYSFGSAVSGSQYRDATHFGRLIGDVNCDRMILTFKTVDDEVLDTLTITKE